MGNEILIPEMPQLRQMVLLGEHLAIVIEVKADCTRKNIDKFMDHMKNHFRPQQPHPLLTPSAPPKLVEVAGIPRLVQQDVMDLVDDHDKETEVVLGKPADGRRLLAAGGGKRGQEGAMVLVQPGNGRILVVDGVAQHRELRIPVVQQPLQRGLVGVYRRRQRLQLAIPVVHQVIAEPPITLQTLQEGHQHLGVVIQKTMHDWLEVSS